LSVGPAIQHRSRPVAALGCAVIMAACAEGDGAGAVVADPVYRGIETRLLDGDLVGIAVEMHGASGPEHVISYAECAAAQYTLIRGYGFARHVRTLVDETGGIWRADAVYTISAALPRGARTIDAEVTVANCALNGIPTV